MDSPLLGTIFAFGFDFAPRGWANCNGQLLSIAQNTALFSILGTTYGGNGVTTFALPDLRGRAVVGWGNGLSIYALGETRGAENVYISSNQLPSHTHSSSGFTLNAVSNPGTTMAPAGNYLAASRSLTTAGYIDSIVAPATLTAMASGAITGSIGIAGSGLPVSMVQPILVINYSIALQGVFPSRN